MAEPPYTPPSGPVPQLPWLNEKDRAAPPVYSTFGDPTDAPLPPQPTPAPAPWATTARVEPATRAGAFQARFGGNQVEAYQSEEIISQGPVRGLGGDQLDNTLGQSLDIERPRYRRNPKKVIDVGSKETVEDLTPQTEQPSPITTGAQSPRQIGVNEWRDRLLPGSWRGVSFEIESYNIPIGRRATVHEFPQRDNVFVEDTGREIRYHKITAYVIGDDYDIKRNTLIAALEFKGPGELCHPYLGRRTCNVLPGGSCTESVNEQRIAKFEMTFVDSDQTLGPLVVKDYTSKAQTAGAAAVAASTKYMQTWDAVMNTEASLYRQAYSAFKGGYASVVAATLNLVVTEFDQRGLFYEASAFISAIREIGDLSLLVKFLKQPAPVDPLASPNSSNAEQALTTWVRTTVADRASTLALVAEYTSYDEAVGVATTIGDQIDIDAEVTLDPESFEALHDMRISLLSAVYQFADVLPRERRLTVNQAIPALVIAYSLYDDPTRDAEIVRRNSIPNPNFVTGSIRILSTVETR